MDTKKFRLITRSDFDGLVCAALLQELDIIDEIKFVHPKDVQDGKIDIGPGDITTNLPYVGACHLSFDHHSSETIRNETIQDNHIIDAKAPSAARVVYDYYGGKDKFKRISDLLMESVDKGDSANFNKQEILHPEGWDLMNFLMDSRTGLGRFHDFQISNYDLMMDLIAKCREMNVAQILSLPDVKERVDLYRKHESLAKQQLQDCSTVHANLILLDLREQEIIHPTNRFMIYALFPDCNISIHQMWGFKKQNTVFAIGKSILNKSSNTNIGELCLKYGGGGHENAGTCQIDNEIADATLPDIIKTITTDG